MQLFFQLYSTYILFDNHKAPQLLSFSPTFTWNKRFPLIFHVICSSSPSSLFIFILFYVGWISSSSSVFFTPFPQILFVALSLQSSFTYSLLFHYLSACIAILLGVNFQSHIYFPPQILIDMLCRLWILLLVERDNLIFLLCV